MRSLARLAVWLGALGVPFTIACAYGMPADYSRTGKVLDAQTHEGIEGIRVACMRGGAVAGEAFSTSGGEVALDTGTSAACDTFEATDVDGDANGGAYAPASIPGGEGTFTLLMTKSTNQ